MGKSRRAVGPQASQPNSIKEKLPIRYEKKDTISSLNFQPRPEWHSYQLDRINSPETAVSVAPDLIHKFHQYAKDLLETESASYTSTHLRSSSSHKFMTTVMSSGTYSDKVSALTLVVQESPLHTSKHLENLVDLSAKHNRTQALMALAALKDMSSQGSMLPVNRKLRMFSRQPELIAALQGVKPSWTSQDSLPNGLTKKHLMLWAFEDRLKHLYFVMLKTLEEIGNDQVEFSRLRAITYVFELLKERPEQEENLLRLLVNKLGDKSRKVASRASYLLLQLQSSHPSMKKIIVEAIESDILLRPGQGAHAKYYAVITLNQTVIEIGDPQTAEKLLDVYFTIFVSILNQSRTTKVVQNQKQTHKGDSKKRKRTTYKPDASDIADQQLDDKIIAQVLTGINRAFPFAKFRAEIFSKHMDTMFKITHSANFNTTVQALSLIQRITSTNEVSNDRFMRTLYESLLDPRLVTSSKHTMYLNLLYRSLKADVVIKRVKAFIKRLLQILSLHEPPFVCAVLYLLHELQQIFPSVNTMLTQAEENDDDQEEHFTDVADARDNNAPTNGDIGSSNPLDSNKSSYDGRKRDPEHSNADQTCLWELLPFQTHYHPSASLFSNRILQPLLNKPFPSKPDPSSHSLSHFLDRFVYRNAKPSSSSTNDTATTPRGPSLMQPALALARGPTTDIFLTPSSNRAAAAAQQPLNSEAFWTQRAGDVKEDEVFFQRYFGAIGPRRKAAQEKRLKKEAEKKKKKTKRDGDDSDGEEADGAVDEDFDNELGVHEDEIWQALVGSAKEQGEMDGFDDDAGDDDGDDDESLEDVDYSDDEEDADGASDGGVELNLDSDPESDSGSAAASLAEEDRDDDDIALNLEDGGEDDSSALFSSEEDVPTDNKAATGPDEEEESDSKAKSSKRRKLKNLPTFASVEDYAAMLEGEEDGIFDD